MTNPDDALVEPSVAASAAAADSPGPPPSSDAPETIKEPHAQPGPDTERPDEISEPKAFDERYKEPFTGLMFLGNLEQTLNIWGHTFRLVTPSQTERMQMGALHKPYAETLASEIAYQTLMVAAFLRSVDNHELPQPVLNDPAENAVRDRFRWAGENLRGPVIDRLFSACLELNAEVQGVLRAMGEAQG